MSEDHQASADRDPQPGPERHGDSPNQWLLDLAEKFRDVEFKARPCHRL
jgi:hypothetical protein